MRLRAVCTVAVIILGVALLYHFYNLPRPITTSNEINQALYQARKCGVDLPAWVFQKDVVLKTQVSADDQVSYVFSPGKSYPFPADTAELLTFRKQVLVKEYKFLSYRYRVYGQQVFCFTSFVTTQP